MQNFEYLDQEIEKRFLALKEQFGDSIRNLGNNLARATQRLSSANKQIAELKEQVGVIKETNLAMVNLIKSIADILNKRIDRTDEFITESIKDVVKLMGDIQL